MVPNRRTLGIGLFTIAVILLFAFVVPTFLLFMESTLPGENLGNRLGAWITDHLEWFTKPWFGPLLAVAILGLGIVVGVWMGLRTRYYAGRIGAARAAIEATPKNGAAFARQFRTISEKIESVEFLTHPWKEYSETLMFPDSILTKDSGELSSVLENTSRPDVFFNVEDLRLQMPVMRAMPGVFVGLGLLMTFIGLVVALTKAAGAFVPIPPATIPSPDAIRQALGDLLTTAGTKFYASIAGLFCSLVLGIVDKRSTAYLDECFAKFAEAVEQRVKFVSPQHLSAASLTELRRQRVSLERFSEELAATMGKSLSEALASLPKSLKDAIEPMTAEIKVVAETISKQSSLAVDDMSKSLVDRMQGMSRDSFDRVTTQLESLTTILSGLGASLSGGGEQMRQEMAKAVSELTGSIGAITSGLQNAAGQASQALGASGSVAAASLVTAIEALRSAGDRSAAQIESVIDKIVAHSDEAAKGAGLRVDAAGKAAAEQVAVAAQDFTESLTAVAKGSADAITEWKTALQDTSRQLGALGLALNNQRDAIERAAISTRDSGETIAQSASALRAVAAPISEATQRIAVASTAAAEAMRSAQTQLEKIGQSVQSATQAIGDAQRQLIDVWEKHSHHLEGADSELEAAFQKIAASVAGNLEVLQKFVDGVDKNLSGSVDSLSAGVDELREFAQDMRDVVERTEKIVRGQGTGSPA